MATTSATRTGTDQSRLVRTLGIIVIIGGLILAIGGATTWGLVQSQLSAEKVTVAEDASFLAGDEVNGPFSAYAQAEIINEHALKASGGKTYAELAQDDPTRATVMNASFLRASLFTSVVSFGVAAMAMGLGVLFLLVGYALMKVAPATARY
ncbi:aromatic ring-opening dioxygenase LigA [Quadrisphaera sp. GCM10027208]|uniref:aromatic ring-opening dioxygenase LigA n=1 Tax=Quadrisphaera sp. GCM10027208 TaxID=3273423 RepID=UPI0036095216|nr:aromatic ring-opening dioxygenase LigA [Kineosporiaceae bacterium SCSIO 59966]